MKNESDHIDEYLLLRYVKGDCTEGEIKQIRSWTDENPENKKALEAIQNIWDHSTTLSDFEKIDVESDWKTVKSRMNFERAGDPGKVERSSLPYVFRVAASIVLVLSIGFFIYSYLADEPEYLAASTTDQLEEVLLPDGSIVYLNEYSELRYPEDFTRDFRQVTLEGEAFFDVTPDKENPFIIKTPNNGGIEVLGTSFNVNVRPGSGKVVVHVVEGVVALFDVQNMEIRKELRENENGILSDGRISKSSHTGNNFLSWKTGKLTFENSPLITVAEELAHHYKKSIQIRDSEIRKLQVTTTIDNQPLQDVLDEITLVLGLRYEVRNDSITIYR